MKKFLQVFYVFFSAILLALSIPNEIFLFGSPYIALIALFPLYIAISNAKSYNEAFLLGALHTFIVHLLSSFWLSFFKDFAIFTLGASALGTAVIGGILGRMLYVPYSIANEQKKLRELQGLVPYNIIFRIFWFACVYTLYEWFKSTGLGFLAYPWGTLSSTAFNWRILMQIADLCGTYGISFLFALCSSICAEGFLLTKNIRHSQNPTSIKNELKICSNIFIILFALSFIYGFVQYTKTRLPQKIINTVMVQQNSNPWEEISDLNSIINSQRLTKEKIDEFISQGKTPHLVIWSEGVLENPFPMAESYYSYYPQKQPLIDFIKETKTPFIIGGSYLENEEKQQYNNSALLFDKDGNFRGSYAKIHLVPFAEVLPGTEYDAVSNFLKKFIGISAGWKAGSQYVLFDIPCELSDKKQLKKAKIISLEQSLIEQEQSEIKQPVARVSTPICFGDAFPQDVCSPLFKYGSEAYMNITDDSWSNTKSAEYQHFVIASYRAIEYRTTLVRSTNAGYSVVLDPSAKIIADMPLFEQSSIAVSIPIYSRTVTVYFLLGDWLPFIFAIFVFSYCIYASLSFKFGEDFIYE